MNRSIRQAAILASLFAIVYGAAGQARWGSPSIVLEPTKREFSHDEFIQYVVRVRPPWLKKRMRESPLTAQPIREGIPVSTIAGQTSMTLAYDRSRQGWVGSWPCPWNAPEGRYQIQLSTTSLPEVAGLKVRTVPFKIIGRKPAPVKNKFAVLTVEDLTDLRAIHWTGPDGQKGDWRVLVDWAEHIGADALWILSADSGGYSARLPEDNPWNARSPSTLRMLGRECHKRGLKFGVWAMCYLVGGNPDKSPNYLYSWEYEGGTLVDGRTKSGRRAISILDPKRPRDIGRLLSEWAALPEVDYVGLDYIRNALGGFEMVDEFVQDMKVPLPPGWRSYSKTERMMWLAKKKVARKDSDFVDAWQWWRAHKASSVIRTVASLLGGEKPLWVFTLSWEKGWQHGQDPIMFRDAGADLDAVMLYECDKKQFASIIHDWETYLDASQVNLLAGDCIDWPLHQKDPSGPEEFKRRVLTGYQRLGRNGPAKGVFIHDLLRAIRGRTGPWGTQKWMETSAQVIADMKSRP